MKGEKTENQNAAMLLCILNSASVEGVDNACIIGYIEINIMRGERNYRSTAMKASADISEGGNAERRKNCRWRRGYQLDSCCLLVQICCIAKGRIYGAGV